MRSNLMLQIPKREKVMCCCHRLTPFRWYLKNRKADFSCRSGNISRVMIAWQALRLSLRCLCATNSPVQADRHPRTDDGKKRRKAAGLAVSACVASINVVLEWCNASRDQMCLCLSYSHFTGGHGCAVVQAPAPNQ